MSEIIKHIESSAIQLESEFDKIQSSYSQSTDIVSKWVDAIVGTLWGETVRSIYESSASRIREQAKIAQARLKIEVSKGGVHQETAKNLQELQSKLTNIQTRKLHNVSLSEAIKNTDAKQLGVNAVYGVKWEVQGVASWLKAILTGALDLATFMSRCSIDGQYRQQVSEQVESLFNWVKKEGVTWIGSQVGKVLDDEMQRISKLPQEKQAEAIGNIAGRVISLLIPVKAGMMIDTKISKISRQTTRWQELLHKWAEGVAGGIERMERLARLDKLLHASKRKAVGLQGANIALNGVAESLIGYGLMKSVNTFFLMLETRWVKLADKVAEREYLMKEIEYTLNTETNPERKSALEKLQSTIYADERVRVLVRKEWRYDTVVETSRAISARMFHVGENILKKNPDISSQEMKNQMITVFKQEWVEFSSKHQAILEMGVRNLEVVRGKRQEQLAEIFSRWKVAMPKDIQEIQKLMNTSPDIQFSEWKWYVYEKWWWEHIMKLFKSYPESAKQAVAKKYALPPLWQSSSKSEIEKLVWYMEWWTKAIQFDILSHPTCIIHIMKTSNSYASNHSLWHMRLNTGKIYVNWHRSASSIEQTIEHEYQHFLNLHFVDSVVHEVNMPPLFNWDLWHTEKMLVRRTKDSIELRMQWMSAKDEIASYLERNWVLPLYDVRPYLSVTADWKIAPLYGEDFKELESFIRNVENVRKNGVTKFGHLTDQEIVDIIRTSLSFSDARKRLLYATVRRLQATKTL